MTTLATLATVGQGIVVDYGDQVGGRQVARGRDVARGGGGRYATPQPEHMPSRWCTGCGGRRRRGDDKTPPCVPRNQEPQSNRRLGRTRRRSAGQRCEERPAEQIPFMFSGGNAMRTGAEDFVSHDSAAMQSHLEKFLRARRYIVASALGTQYLRSPCS